GARVVDGAELDVVALVDPEEELAGRRGNKRTLEIGKRGIRERLSRRGGRRIRSCVMVRRSRRLRGVGRCVERQPPTERGRSAHVGRRPDQGTAGQGGKVVDELPARRPLRGITAEELNGSVLSERRADGGERTGMIGKISVGNQR